MKTVLLSISTAIFLVTSCNIIQKENQQKQSDSIATNPLPHTDKEPIPYILAKNYFVKNTVGEEKNGVHKLESQADFDSLFSAAATMGKDGMPTAIDFDKQYVIAIITASSDLTPTIDNIILEKQGKEIAVTYKEVLGEKQSYQIRPVAILIVDKQFQGPLKSEIQKEI